MLSLLNKNLGQMKKVVFAFPPIAIPIDSFGMVVKEHEARENFYITVVFNQTDNVFEVFEFDSALKHALAAYKNRNDGLEGLRFLISRNEDGTMRFTTGNKEERELPIVSDEIKNIHKQLYSVYLNKINYTVNDFRRTK